MIIPSRFRHIAALGIKCRIASNIKIMTPSEEKKRESEKIEVDSLSKDSMSEGSISSEEYGLGAKTFSTQGAKIINEDLKTED